MNTRRLVLLIPLGVAAFALGALAPHAPATPAQAQSMNTPTPTPSVAHCPEAVDVSFVTGNLGCGSGDPEPGPGGMPLWLTPPTDCPNDMVSAEIALDTCDKGLYPDTFFSLECFVATGVTFRFDTYTVFETGTVSWYCCEDCN
jgi:hypothetical protein